jgi:hypothetical protein
MDPPLLPDTQPQFLPPPAPARATSSPRPNAAKPSAPQAAEIPAPDPPPVRQLGQIFTPDDIRTTSMTLDQILLRVKGDVNTFDGKNLKGEDRSRADLVKNFLMQAEQIRGKDLSAAVSFAKRAEALAKDLLEHLQ